MKPKPSGIKDIFLALGIVHILSSIFPAYTLPFTFDHFIYALKNPDRYGNGYWDALYNFHLSFLFGPFAFISACFFLANNRIGWSGMLVSIVCNTIVLSGVFIAGLSFFMNENPLLLLIPFLFLIFEVGCFVLLWKEKQRKSFKVDTNTIVITAGLLFVLLCDGVWGYLNLL